MERLYTEPLRCGIVYEKIRVKSLLPEGLGESVGGITCVYLEQHFRAPLKELSFHADKLINIADKNLRVSEPAMHRLYPSAVKPNRSYAHKEM